MIMLQATLVAGPAHRKYSVGQSLPAIIFVEAESETEALKIAESELQDLGWATMAHERTKDVLDYNQFAGKDPILAEAFEAAISDGFGIVVYPDSST